MQIEALLVARGCGRSTRGRHRAGRGGLHQGVADVGAGHGLCDRAAPDSVWNNPEPRSSCRRQPRADRRCDARQRRQPARLRGRSALLLARPRTTTAPARSGRSSACSTPTTASMICAARSFACACRAAPTASSSTASSMAQISRDPDLVTQSMGAVHQYPDGMMLFCGTMFAPVQDRWRRRAGLHAPPGRPRDDRQRAPRRARQRGPAQRPDPAVAVRHRRADGEPGAARVALSVSARLRPRLLTDTHGPARASPGDTCRVAQLGRSTPSRRLRCAARSGRARRNSLRSLRSLRSDSRRGSDHEARTCGRASPALRCSPPHISPVAGVP